MNPIRSLINKIYFYYLNYLLKNEYLNQTDNTFNERSVEYSFVFKQLTKYCPKEILDVGTGMSALPHLMRNCGFKVTAIDNIKDYWPKGMINRHFYVINDDITKSKLDRKFNLITCISTLEHIVDFEKAIVNMCELLKPNGKIILTFPYNEYQYCENVYMLEDSAAPKNFPFKTQAFSRKEVDNWCKANKLEIIEQEYWKFFSGNYWTTGERLKFPIASNQFENHQISCMIFTKE
jgi:2-polyprenyl-3-methyl-5-hydroxy-6-metoxy-1,4-benzoquinol methylase